MPDKPCDNPVPINPVTATGFVRSIKVSDYEASGQPVQGFLIVIEKINPPGPPWDVFRAVVCNPLFQSLLSIAFANGIMVEVEAHSMDKVEGFPIVDYIHMPPESFGRSEGGTR